MEEHGRSDPDTSGDLPVDTGEGLSSQEADPREPPDLQEADTDGPQESGDNPGAAREITEITPRIPRPAATPRGMRPASQDPTEEGTDAVWDAYFERCEKRIARADTDRYSELRKIRKRKGIIFVATCLMAVLALADSIAVSTLLIWNAVRTGHSDPNLTRNLIALGGGLAGTGTITGILAVARRALRSDEDILIKQGREIARIEAVMVAARVTTDEEKRCEILGDMTRSLNALLIEEEPETRRGSRGRRRRQQQE